MRKMVKILGMVAFLAFLCGLRLEAQEAVSQTIPSSEVKQGASHGISLGDRQAYHLKSPHHATSPFPVSTPVAIVYPKKAVRKGWEGQTIVAAEVLADGSVGRTVLAKSSGHDILDDAAREAIKTWKFAFESEKNETVPQYVDIPVTFKLEDQ